MTNPTKTPGAMVLENVLQSLKQANETGVIIDTIWTTDKCPETLFDYLERMIEAEHPPAVGGEPEDYPPCDYCGVVPDYHPWHGAGIINGEESPHIHACTECRDKLPVADHVAPLLAEIERLKSQLDGLANYLPSPEATNNLPEGLRAYVASLQTLCDPSAIVAENTLLRDQTKQLDAMIGRLKRDAVQSQTRIAELEGKQGDACATIQVESLGGKLCATVARFDIQQLPVGSFVNVFLQSNPATPSS